MQRYIDPGLPPWPPLYFDEENRCARVSVRIADWRSFDRGILATKVCVIPAAIYAMFRIWMAIPDDQEPLVRFVMWLAGVGIVVPLLVSSAEMFLPRSFASTLFAHNLKFIATADAVGFRSWFYDRGLRVGRGEGRDAVLLRTMLGEDRDAEARLEQLSDAPPNPAQRRYPKSHLKHAKVIDLVIESGISQQRVSDPSSATGFRSIAIAGADSKQGEMLTMVFNTAIRLTTETSSNRSGLGPSEGMDLDLSH
ncbi:hypothetical protein NHH03_14095 [Stieleria sp. TO1_6]|uniref:hypothetical protein n=1 Tax=Stieleria tagensis TaxID=2956795 RepID=UPI00209A7E75|nr:hypothetical protein [Stieleria tagensis]MCO8122875.1 hypothetical protein [Stieleria tagensis]